MRIDDLLSDARVVVPAALALCSPYVPVFGSSSRGEAWPRSFATSTRLGRPWPGCGGSCCFQQFCMPGSSRLLERVVVILPNAAVLSFARRAVVGPELRATQPFILLSITLAALASPSVRRRLLF